MCDKKSPDLPCHRIGRIQNLRPPRRNLFNEWLEVRKMRTAKDQVVGPRLQKRLHTTADDLLGLLPRSLAPFHQRHKLVGHTGKNDSISGESGTGFTIKTPIKGTLRCQYANDAALAGERGWLHGRFHAYEWNLRPSCAQGVDRRRRSRVAGHDYNLACMGK